MATHKCFLRAHYEGRAGDKTRALPALNRLRYFFLDSPAFSESRPFRNRHPESVSSANRVTPFPSIERSTDAERGTTNASPPRETWPRIPLGASATDVIRAAQSFRRRASCSGRHTGACRSDRDKGARDIRRLNRESSIESLRATRSLQAPSEFRAL